MLQNQWATHLEKRKTVHWKKKCGCPWVVELQYEWSLMLWLFIASSKVAILLKHLNSTWPHFLKIFQWHSFFLPLDFVPLTCLEEWDVWEGLWTLVFILLWGCCFLGFFVLSLYYSTNSLYEDVLSLLIIPKCMTISFSPINESQKDWRVLCILSTQRFFNGIKCRYNDRIGRTNIGKNMKIYFLSSLVMLHYSTKHIRGFVPMYVLNAWKVTYYIYGNQVILYLVNMSHIAFTK